MEEHQEKKAENNEKKHIPYQFLYLSWALCFLTTITCSVMLVLYGMGFGNATSWEWLTTIFLSLFKDVFALQPIKIFVVSLVTSLVWKKVNFRDENDLQKKSREQAVNKALIRKEVAGKDFLGSIEGCSLESLNLSANEQVESKKVATPTPPKKTDLETSRRASLKRVKLRKLAKELFIHIVFIVLAFQTPISSFHETQSPKAAYVLSGNVDNGRDMVYEQVIIGVRA